MKAKTKEELIELYYKKHGNYYDYSKLDLKNKTNGKVIIICQKHGEFTQNHLDHVHSGCPKCSVVDQKLRQSKILINDISDLERATGGKFDFSQSQFKNTSSKLYVKCKDHNLFFYNTAHHIARGAGCNLCKKEKISLKKRLTLEQFISKANKKHNGKYDYSKVEYKNLLSTIEIICPEHGIFKQKPRDHIAGSGCQLCSNAGISKISQEWLESFNISTLLKEHIIVNDNKWYKVDGYDPITNSIYEFYGDYWHGNPKLFQSDDINPSVDLTFGELYNKTIERELILKSLGFNLITIWESDYVKNNNKHIKIIE